MYYFRCVVGILCIFLLYECNAKGKDEVESNIGGGECITHQDCNANGVCESTDGQDKGTCFCNIKFRGPYCEEKSDMKLTGKEIKPDGGSDKSVFTESTRTSSKSDIDEAGKRSDVLEYDTFSNVVGLDPKVLADTDQPFLIYSPKEKKYLYMSSDKTMLGKRNTFVEAKDDRNEKRNLFTLKSFNGKYHIFNVNTERYVYVSKSTTGVFQWKSNNVLGAEGKPADQPTPKKFEFEFEGNDAGFYKIKHEQKYLFVAIARSGIPFHNIIEADDEDRTDDQTDLFQFVLKKKATVTVEYKPEKMIEEKAVDIDCGEHKYENKNEDAADLVNVITFDKAFTTTSSYSKTVGYTLTGSFTAGVSVLNAVKLGSTVSASRASTEQTMDTKTEQQKFAESFTVTVKGGQLVCVVILIDRSDYSIPFEMTALTSDKKILKATGRYRGSKHYNTRASQEVFKWEANKKCPYEEKKLF